MPLTASHDVPAWWPTLFEQLDDPSIFLSAAWMNSWLAVFGSGFSGYWICWEAGGELVGGCLLLLRTVRLRGLPMHAVFLNTTENTSERSPLAEFNQVLCRPGFERPIAASLADFVNRLRWTQFHLPAHEDSQFCREFIARLSSSWRSVHQLPAPYVDFVKHREQSFDTLISANTRAQIRRTSRGFEQRHGAVKLQAASNCEQALQYLEELARLHNATWQARGKSGAFAGTAYLEFHRRLLPQLWRTGGVDLLRMRAGDVDIGYLYLLLDGRRVCFFQSGFAYESDPKIKPGSLMHKLAIEHYCERGYREYDFLAGDARYKRSFAKSERLLYWTVLYRRSCLAYLLKTAKFLRDRWRLSEASRKISR